MVDHTCWPYATTIKREVTCLNPSKPLFTLYALPGKCHALKNDLAGKYAVHLAGGYVLIFAPANDPVPLNAGGAVDPLKVTAVRIVAIEDYHD